MLPSKKILVALAILIVGIGILITYSYTKKNNSRVDDNLVVATSSSLINIDSNRFPDWKKDLYSTTPQITNSATKNIVSSSTAEEKLTLTDTFARSFFTQYMNLQQTGVKVTSDNAAQIAGDYLKNAKLPTITAKQYTLKDLSLTDSDQTRLKNYRDSITAIFTQYWPKGNPNELTIFQQAFVNNDSKALSKLTLVISAYQNTLNHSLILAVPKLTSNLHLNLINSISSYIQTLKMIQLAYTDPLSGLVGLNSYADNQANISLNLTNLQNYFINNVK